MTSFAVSPDYRHVPTSRLALLAQRAGQVFASASTGYRIIRRRGWRRPRLRVYPANPKIGLRTDRPDAAWHIDTTIIRLLDGTKLYLHGAIDNFSRRILAWHLAAKFGATNTATILCMAIAGQVRARGDEPPLVVVDAGTENFNQLVDEIVTTGALRRVLAQTEIRYSNSRIEAFWRSAKSGHLYMHTLDTFATVERLVGFYVHAHNSQMPLPKFGGRTPDEVYGGLGVTIPDDLEDARAEARLARLEANRARRCGACASPSRSPPSAKTLAA